MSLSLLVAPSPPPVPVRASPIIAIQHRAWCAVVLSRCGAWGETQPKLEPCKELRRFLCCGGLKKPQFANKDLLRVCEGSLGREKVITWQQLLVTCFPGNLAALPAGIWIEVKLLEASMPLAPWAFSFSPSARCGRAQHERQYPAPMQAAEGSCWPQRQGRRCHAVRFVSSIAACRAEREEWGVGRQLLCLPRASPLGRTWGVKRCAEAVVIRSVAGHSCLHRRLFCEFPVTPKDLGITLYCLWGTSPCSPPLLDVSRIFLAAFQDSPVYYWVPLKFRTLLWV